jgi:type IV secretion system protein VirD4
MKPTLQNVLKVALGASVFALLPGMLVASIYVTFKDGFAVSKLENIDIFAFWQETPFVTGSFSPTFQTGMMIIGAIAIAIFVAGCAMSFKAPLETHGTAAWATVPDMAEAGYLKSYRDIIGPIFGKAGKPKSTAKYLTNGDQPHSLIVAPTRAGKGVGVVIPTLLTFNGSAIVLDVKGELFDLSSRARKARGDRVFKFSPIDPKGLTHRFNPVDDVRAAPKDRQFLEARRLAANLVVAKNKGAEGFIDGARDLFVAGIMACIERGTPTIGAVYDLFSQPGEKYKLFASLAEETKSPEARRIFDNMAANDTKILTSYTSVLGDGGLNLWADQLVKNATDRSDFSIYELRRDPTTVYIVVSPNDLEVLSPLIRLLFQQIVSILQRTLPEKDEIFEVLFLLDEFKHLGKMDAVETAITTIAGYNGRFMFVVQTLSALTANYEQAGKENFLGNTGIQVFMATGDAETPEYISKAIGDFTYVARSSSHQSTEFFQKNIQEHEDGAALIRPEQVRLMDDDTQIVLIKGRPAMRMNKVKYYSDKILKPIFEGQKGPLPEPPPATGASHIDEPHPDPHPVAMASHENATDAQGNPIVAAAPPASTSAVLGKIVPVQIPAPRPVQPVQAAAQTNGAAVPAPAAATPNPPAPVAPAQTASAQAPAPPHAQPVAASPANASAMPAPAPVTPAVPVQAAPVQAPISQPVQPASPPVAAAQNAPVEAAAPSQAQASDAAPKQPALSPAVAAPAKAGVRKMVSSKNSDQGPADVAKGQSDLLAKISSLQVQLGKKGADKST